jgi:cytochrome c553
LVTHDGATVVAADPDRDLLYVIDASTELLRFVRQLAAGDEPGRVVEDTAGRIHVALRGAGMVASLSLTETAPIERRAVCDLPRGLAYDAADDVLQVGCAEGKLVTLAAAPSGSVARTVDLGVDVRDVLVRGSELFVSRFRSAELLKVDRGGDIVARVMPPTFSQQETIIVPDENGCGSRKALVKVPSSPTLAWRMLDVPGGGVAMLHQRAREGEVQVTPGGYGGGFGCSSGIVHSALTMGLETEQPRSFDMSTLALAVDIAMDPDGVLLAAVGPGNWGVGGLPQVELYRVPDLANQSALDVGGTNCVPPPVLEVGPPQLVGQATAVAFSSPYVLAVQSREPAGLDFIDVRNGTVRSHLDLKQASRFDTGHTLFHVRAGAGLACASCHGEGGDDGHVWSFHGIGARRTQQLRGGILGTEPFHWNGDMQDFPTLVQEVFVGRMRGLEPTAEQTDALATWIDRQPALRVTAGDADAVERGRGLFESAELGCASCHAGAQLTNNQTVDVGTGVALQVPSLHDVALRTPLMHDGCAKTLQERFSVSSCGGGDSHGHTSQLTADALADLVAYLSTL